MAIGVAHPGYASHAHDASYQAYSLLRIGFVVLPILAGLDKFLYWMVDWTAYLAPVFPDLLNVEPRTFMMGVGVIEILAGVAVLFWPRIGATIVGLWLLGIVFNLLLQQTYYDIALRDLGLAIGAFALARLATSYHRDRHPETAAA